MRTTMTSFLSNVFLRATDPAHYKGLKQKTFYQATGYLFMLLVLISYISTTMKMLELRSYLPSDKPIQRIGGR